MSYDSLPTHESTRKRRRWGCTCGCLFILIILLIGGSLGTYFLFRPVKAPQQFAFMTSQTNGYGVIRLNSTDAGVSDFINFAAKRLEQVQTAGLAENEAQIMKALIKIGRTFTTSLVRTECPIYLTFDPAVRDERIILEVSLKNWLGRLISLNFLQSHFGKPTVQIDKTALYVLSTGPDPATSGPALALTPSQAIYSDNGNFLHQVFEKSTGSQVGTQPGPNLQRFIDELSLDKPPEGEDFAVALINQQDRFENILGSWEQMFKIPGLTGLVQQALNSQNVSFADIEGLKVSGDLTSADKIKMEVTLYFQNSALCNKASAGLKTMLSQIPQKREGNPFECIFGLRVRGSAVVITVDISGLRSWVGVVFPDGTTPSGGASNGTTVTISAAH